MKTPAFRPGKFSPVIEFGNSDDFYEDDNCMVLCNDVENEFCPADQATVNFLSDRSPDLKLGDNIFDYVQDFLPANYRWEYPGFTEKADNSDNFSVADSDVSHDTHITIPDDESSDKHEIVQETAPSVPCPSTTASNNLVTLVTLPAVWTTPTPPFVPVHVTPPAPELDPVVQAYRDIAEAWKAKAFENFNKYQVAKTKLNYCDQLLQENRRQIGRQEAQLCAFRTVHTQRRNE